MSRTNSGKVFESCFTSSYSKDDILVYRLKDSPGVWGGRGLKFTASNICDFIVYKSPVLFFLELKTIKGKSFPYAKIKPNQIMGLQKVSIYPNVAAGVVINFSDLEETYFLPIDKFVDYQNTHERTSLPIDFLRESGIKIGQEKKRTRYAYDLDGFVNNYIKGR